MNEKKQLLHITVKYNQHHIIVASIKVFSAILILLISLSLYFIGVLLTITIIGAFLGIPVILSTYLIDMLALSVIMNPREKIIKVNCPECNKGKFILPAINKEFLCSRCKVRIMINTQVGNQV